MTVTAKRQGLGSQAEAVSQPPGKGKIVEALKSLLREKEFDAITWSEMARTAGVTEGLIYKYFGDRRNLLFHVLKEYLEIYLQSTQRDLKGVEGSINKLRKLIWSTIDFYTSDVVFAKILLLEVRNLPNYFESDTYLLVKDFSTWVLGIIKEGVEEGEIRDDIPPERIRDALLGGIEHFCLPGIIFGRTMDPDELSQSLCTILFESIRKTPEKDEQTAK